MSIVLDVVKANLPINAKQTPSGWTTINCPCCIHYGQSRPDTRHRGGFIFTPEEGIIYHCFNCNYKAGWKPTDRFTDRFKKLLRYLFNLIAIDIIIFFLPFLNVFHLQI